MNLSKTLSRIILVGALGIYGECFGIVPVTSGLIVHLDAAHVSTTTYNGNTVVGPWNDLMVSDGRADNAVQPIPARMPLWLASSPVSSGLPVLYFDGEDDYLTISHHQNLNPEVVGLTVFVVGKVDDKALRFWLRKGNVWSGQEGYSIWSDDLERIILRCNADNVNDDAHKSGTAKSQPPASNISVYSGLTAVTMEIIAGGGSGIDGYVNGIGAGWTDWYGGSYTGIIDNNDNLTIGTTLRGYIAEVLIYKTVLPALQRQSVVDYLTSKYNLDTVEADLLDDYWAAPDKADYLANFTQEQQVRLMEAEQTGMLKSVPLVVPAVGDWLQPGWPVAVKAGNNVSLFFRNHDMMLSSDGGDTWVLPIDMAQFINTPNSSAGKAGMQAVGTTALGDMILVDGVNNYGVFRSSDGGQSWQHYPEAFTAAQLAGPLLNNGPKIIQHPFWGLAVFPNSLEDVLWIRYSQDDGGTWSEASSPLPESFAKNAEACAIVYNDAIIMLGRCHSQECYEPGPTDPDLGTYSYVQLWSANGQFPYQARRTNIKATGTSYGIGMWGQDTADIVINPWNGRLEAVVTNRNGGEPGDEMNLDIQTLNLWSIDPEALLAGEATWRFEGTLLTRRKFQGAIEVEGMHPAAAVINQAEGVQHIFVYMGMRNLVYGVFQVTRSLDTSALSTFLRSCPRDGPLGRPTDLNEDCIVDWQDLLLFSTKWLKCTDPATDNACGG